MRVRRTAGLAQPAAGGISAARALPPPLRPPGSSATVYSDSHRLLRQAPHADPAMPGRDRLLPGSWTSGGREAAEAGDLAAACGRGPRGVERDELLLRGLAIRRLRELVDQPLVGLDRFLVAVELLESDRQLVEGHVLGQRRIRLVEHLPQLLRHLLSLPLAAIELQQIDARLDGQH